MQFAAIYAKFARRSVLLLRRVFGRTPPQRENGWVRLSDEFPAPPRVRYDGKIDVYRQDDDLTFEASFWRLKDVMGRERRRYYWKQISSTVPVDRHLRYIVRSHKVFG